MEATHRQRSVGIVGAGYIATFHVDALIASDIEIVGICDLDVELAKSLADRAGTLAYASIDEMLAQARPGAVHILTPPQTHADLAARALGAGCDVFVEKPLATTTEDADRLMDLARSSRRRLGVGLNFLFAGPYVRLHDAVERGDLGRLDHVDIVWHRPLGQLQATSHRDWMLQHPSNILFEVGPHVLAHLVDLVGVPDRIRSSVATDPIAVSNGAVFYRRWEILADVGRTSVRMRLGLGSGYTEQYLHVRGTAGTATADLEKDTLSIHRETGHLLDIDRFLASAGGAARELRDSSVRLARVVVAKAGLLPIGGAYAASIADAIATFHRDNPDDPRIGARLGREVVHLAEQIAAATTFEDAPITVRSPASTPDPAFSEHATSRGSVLVLGATGFIGRRLVGRLRAAGFGVRCAVRQPRAFPAEANGFGVEVVRGDLQDTERLTELLDGVTHVVHLARGHGNDWADLLVTDVDPTERFAAECARRGVQQFVYTSSIVLYQTGKGSTTITEDTPPDEHIAAAAPYARSKLENERRLRALQKEAGLALTILRPGVVIGTGADPRHWGVAAWPSRSVAALWGRGDSELPLVLVDDVAEAIVLTLVTDASVGESYNLVAGGGITAVDYLDRLVTTSGERIRRRVIPPWRWQASAVAKWAVKRAAGDRTTPRPTLADFSSRTFRAAFDCTNARGDLGWQPLSDRDDLLKHGIDDAVAAASH